MKKEYDVYIVGLGGQGILTIGDLLAHAALRKGITVNFYPTKGMSQRGGFVQGQLRFGRENVGASLPPKGADLVVAMERSEALKGIKFAKENCDFLLFDDVWATSAVLMGKAQYPALDEVEAEIKKANVKLYLLNDASLPLVDGKPVRANMFILGALLAHTGLKELFTKEEILEAIKESFSKGFEANVIAVEAGYNAHIELQ